MSSSESGSFLDEALRVGRTLAGATLRSKGQATWLADEIAFVDERWQPVVATIGPGFGTGTAGVGWLLARLAAMSGDDALADAGEAALRHGLEGAAALVRAGRLDWYHGASGIAWAAIDAGHALRDTRLVTGGVAVADGVAEAVHSRLEDPSETALVGGEAGVLAGLLALARTSATETARPAVRAAATRLAGAVRPLPPDASASKRGAGLARGLSGVGLVLAVSATALGDAACRDAAECAFAAERLSFDATTGWSASPSHPWPVEPPVPAWSWCGGAAGIGIARLAAHSIVADLLLLAEAGAAIEVVRRGLAVPDHLDTSLCHGATGAIELLVVASALLAEPAHLTAARRAGGRLIERARQGGYGSGADGCARNPSLLFGLAGTLALLVRLHDPGSLPSPALPPILPSTTSAARGTPESYQVQAGSGAEVTAE